MFTVWVSERLVRVCHDVMQEQHPSDYSKNRRIEYHH
jgi:hypothetical protein